MDHLPKAATAFAHIRVPFVDEITFDGGDFVSFPYRAGFNNDFATRSVSDIASLAQGWLYFGTLQVFLGVDFDRNEFRASHPEGDHVSSRPLRQLLTSWLLIKVIPILGPEVVAKTSLSSALELYQSKKPMMEFLETVLKEADALEIQPQASSDPLPAILLSVRVLVVTLSGVLEETIGQNNFNLLGHYQYPYKPGAIEKLRFVDGPSNMPKAASANFLSNEIIANGWCPFIACKVLSSYNYVVAYYISRLRPHNPTHHDLCSENECIAYNVDMSRYRSKHASPDCNCSHVALDAEQVRSIIREGGVPIVSIRFDEQEPKLDVIKMTNKTPYIAFSHVWSDGLGNPAANSLPRCQIIKLAKYIKELKPPKIAPQQGVVNIGSLRMDFRRMTRTLETSHFWLDTLCIPVGEQYFDLKMKAINQMAAIYAGASQVLILDSNMEQLSLDGPGVEACEILARMCVSPWMGRSWTFQEAAISTIRQVRCSERAFVPNSVSFGYPNYLTKMFDADSIREWIVPFFYMVLVPFRAFRRAKDNDMSTLRRQWTTMSTDIQIPLVALISRPLNDKLVREFLGVKLIGPDFEDMDALESLYQRFVSCWNTLSSRATTKKDDLHIIFANLLEFNAATIIKLATPAERMATLLLSLPYIPLSLYFCNDGIRDRPGEVHYNRWVPIYPSGGLLDLEPRVHMSKNGLWLSCATDNQEEADDEPSKESPTTYARPIVILLESRWLDLDCQQIIPDKALPLKYNVKLHRQEGDKLITDFEKGGAALLVFTKELIQPGLSAGITLSPKPIQGALFQILNVIKSPSGCEAEKGEVKEPGREYREYRVVFDCPVSASLDTGYTENISSFDLGGDSNSNATLLPEPWRLNICHDAPKHVALPLPRRPVVPSWAFLFSVASFMLWFCWVSGLISMFVLIAICAKYSSTFSPFTITVVAVYFSAEIVPWLFIQPLFPIIVPYISDICGIVSSALYAVSRIASNNSLRPLEVAFVTLGMLIGVSELCIRAANKWYLGRKLYDAWLDTFSEDWSPEKETWWTRIVRVAGAERYDNTVMPKGTVISSWERVNASNEEINFPAMGGNTGVLGIAAPDHFASHI
ncbi:unnamed protein product [Clonostachys rhizophaga]|uniref:Heterokaryon incompatibility domain-containing protein n=1 Tax=Clonostachys rhizophaga TaxID=160324 RepID=A0A9N9V1Y6_9HYPO|nr:unnamed protein product [Clonostachys rhizophaga]